MFFIFSFFVNSITKQKSYYFPTYPIQITTGFQKSAFMENAHSISTILIISVGCIVILFYIVDYFRSYICNSNLDDSFRDLDPEDSDIFDLLR